MRYRVTHRTEYRYDSTVVRGYSEAHLTPRSDQPGQRLLRHRLDVQPVPAYQSRRLDFHGNDVFHFQIQRPHTRLVVTAVSEVERSDDDARLPSPSNRAWQRVVAATAGDDTRAGLEARSFLLESPLVSQHPAITAFAAECFPSDRPFAEALQAFIGRVHREFTFDPTATTVSTPIEQVFRARRGVCQDFAHLVIAGLRGLGIAARYVSGYLETIPPDGQAKLVGSDASHAWVAVYEPGVGWSEFDPTNDIKPSRQHIVTALGRDYSDITPLKGVVFGGGPVHETVVGVDVVRLPVSGISQ